MNKNDRPTVTVGLLWHSLTAGNLGVGALTESNMALVMAEAEAAARRVHFVVMGTGTKMLLPLQQELAQRGHSVEVVAVRTWHSSFDATLRRCDVVLDIGEGDSFATIYGFKRFFYYWLSKNRVHWAGRPLVLAPQTIGPFDGWLAETMARQTMRRCRIVYARDELSSHYLQQLGVTEVSRQAIDVAFALPFARQRPDADDVVSVGVNVSGLLYSGGYTQDNQFGLTVDYRRLMERLVQQLVAQPGVHVHLVGHVITPGRPVEDDREACQRLAEPYGDHVTVAPAFGRPSEAKSYIAGMDYFTGARMHACIAAFSAGVPVIPMAYSRKFNGLFGTLGYRHLADLKAMNDDQAFEAVMTGFHRRATLQDEVRQALTTVQQRLDAYRQGLAEVIGAVRR